LAIQRIERSLRLLPGHAGPQPADHCEPGHARLLEPIARHHLRLQADGEPYVGSAAHGLAEKLQWCDADDGRCRVVDVQHMAERGRAAVEFARPERIAQNRHRRRSCAIIIRLDHAAHSRGHTESAEVRAADQRSAHAAKRTAVTQDGFAQWEFADAEHILEHLLVVGEFPKEGITDVDRRTVLCELDLHQARRMAHWQFAKEDCVERLIDRDVRPDPERQCEHGSKRKARTVAKFSQCVDEVLDQRVEERQASLLAIVFANRCEIAQTAFGLGECLVGREARAFEIGGQQIEVSGKLGLQLRRPRAASQHSGEQHAQSGHDSLSSIRAIMATVRDQLPASTASCFFPARVME
jgi:hypothetical protein